MKDRTISLIIALLAAPLCASGYAADDMLESLESLEDDASGIEAIALYPEELRHAILEAAAHPELIVKVAALQEKSSAGFAELLSDYARQDQEAIWDLVRFPGLVEQLVEGDIKSKSQIGEILEDYPKKIHKKALKYGREEYDLLAEIHQLNQAAEERFAHFSADYPEEAVQSFRKLVHHPEILTILDENMRHTILLGDVYQKHPQEVRAWAAERNLELAREHATAARELADETEPEVDEEMEEVARDYAERYGYDASGFAGPESDGEVEITYDHYPYPYWFGYPRWYASPYWHTSLNWYITPNVYASFSLYPRLISHRFYGPHHHIATWSRTRIVRPVKVVRTPQRRISRRR